MEVTRILTGRKIWQMFFPEALEFSEVTRFQAECRARELNQSAAEMMAYATVWHFFFKRHPGISRVWADCFGMVQDGSERIHSVQLYAGPIWKQHLLIDARVWLDLSGLPRRFHLRYDGESAHIMVPKRTAKRLLRFVKRRI